jgi:dipeptidyl aminopeptidase/acylaminoacyl peptidase
MLLRAEPLDPDHDFFQIVPTFDGSAHRILHTTVDGNGDPATSTGVVLIPAGTAPNGGWPVIAWAHGTVGVSDCIAPSRTDGPDVDGGGYASSWAAWLSEGYAVVASDFAGHGTQGEIFYTDGRSQAYNDLPPSDRSS